MIRTVILRFLQRSDFLRFLLLPLVFVLFALLIAGVTVLFNRKPYLQSISPAIAEPGEVLVLQGKHFGKDRGDAWIEIAGSRLSGSTYIQWSDTTIMAQLPEAAEDGLLFVINRNGRSNPLIFANKNNIPVAARVDVEIGLPEITSTGALKMETGKTIAVYGKNFGITKNSSKVLFAWQTDPATPPSAASPSRLPSIAGSEHDFDYVFWSDIEIRVRVPDGAVSGNVFVETDRGISNPIQMELVNQPGTKKYVKGRTYVLSLGVDITGVSASDGNALFVRIPLPEKTASQRDIEVKSSSPKPYMDNYRGAILHQLENLKSGRNEKIEHSFLLTAYGIMTDVKPALVKPYGESPLFLMYTGADKIVPSDNQDIILEAASITGKETNPYLKARLLYDWIRANIAVGTIQNPDRSVLDSLKGKSGDAYDMAVLFCALARSAGIPSVPVAGIVVDSGRNSRIHWWSEFYLENFGWVPVDPGRGDLSSFGSLDSSHIAFSRGWADDKPMTMNSRIVYRPRSFAFQPIWEESSGNIKSYTSFWAEPKITGVY